MIELFVDGSEWLVAVDGGDVVKKGGALVKFEVHGVEGGEKAVICDLII